MSIKSVTTDTASTDELTRLRSAFASTLTAMMMVDRDLNITYVNEATRSLLARHEKKFQTVWPSFEAGRIVGSNIDMFHKNPAHQRRMLADPKNLPHSVDIHVGELIFNINVSAQFDDKGQYIGNTLEWYDVTEQRATQRRAERQEDDWGGQLKAIDKSLAVIEFELDGTIINANQNFCSAIGYTIDEIRGKHHSLFVDPQYRDSSAYALFWEDLRRGVPQSGEMRRRTRDGKDLWLQASYNPIADRHGKLFKVVKYASDITEQVNVRETARTLSLVANETDNSVIITDPQGRIEYCNPGFTRLTGFSAEEAIGRRPGDLLQGPLTDPETKRRIREKLAAQQPFYEEILNYNKDGKSYWISLAINPVFKDGKIDKFVSIQANINDVKLQQLDFNTQLNAISKACAVIEFTPDGRIVTANENFCATTGYALAEIKGQHHRMFVEPEYGASPEYRMFWEKLGRGELDAGKYKRIGKGGKAIWIQASYYPILDQEGRVNKVVKFATDITAQEIAAANQARLVAETSRVMAGVAAGDLTQFMVEDYDGDLAQLKDSVNDCVAKLQHMVNQINEAAGSISTSAVEISQGNQDLSARTEQQASSLEETASSMEELTGTVRQNADNARQANQLAAGARELAERGGSVVSTAISAMGEINKASKKIADIIGVIDEIAFQTNLLALNAAVEAARAGEQGRGFAVVATEVRNLAQRSAGAAKEIKSLIKDSVEKVEEGSRLVNNSGATLQEIVGSVKKVSDIIAEIAAASEEQSTGIEQVNKAVTSMDQAVQQNAALVEQAAAASESMDEQARTLTDLMNFFRVDDSGTGSAPAAVRRPAPAPAPAPERRTSPNRPWTKPAGTGTARTTGTAGTPRPAAPRRAASGEDSDWQEF